MRKITVYALNLPEREDRRKSIKKQFIGRSEFDFSLEPAIKHEIGAFGQWQAFVKLVKQEMKKNSKYFIFCEDDHIFTKEYNFQYLLTCIHQADNLEADMLCGGIAFAANPIGCTDHLFWIKTFNGMQFTIIYNRFYKKIIKSDTREGFVTDIYLSGLSEKIFVMYPFISKQREFGYSDITEQNNQKGYVRNCFKNTEEKFRIIKKVEEFYGKAFRNIR